MLPFPGCVIRWFRSLRSATSVTGMGKNSPRKHGRHEGCTDRGGQISVHDTVSEIAYAIFSQKHTYEVRGLGRACVPDRGLDRSAVVLRVSVVRSCFV